MILISACLLGEKCRYNGSHKRKESLLQIINPQEILSVCPEVLGGLSTPRCPAEIFFGRVIQKDGKDVTKNFHEGCEKVMDLIGKQPIEYAILQSRSPSCGVREVYDGTFSNVLIKGKGIFAQFLEDQGIPIYDIEEFLNEKG